MVSVQFKPDEPLIEIRHRLAAAMRRADEGDVFEITVPNPDLGVGRYDGEVCEQGVHRSYRLWCDLADVLGLRLLTPTQLDDAHISLRFQIPHQSASPHQRLAETPVTEKYGVDSVFARIDKREDPHFLEAYGDAVAAVAPGKDSEILALGVNRGDELAVLEHFLPPRVYESLRVTGIDHCASALAQARTRFGDRYRFLCGDLADLPEDQRFDLILSHGTLQSPGVDGKQLLTRLVKTMLKPGGALIFSFPNCRYQNGALIYGARVRNYRKPELSLLVNDLSFYKKYLQKARFRVTLTGKYDIFLTALPA